MRLRMLIGAAVLFVPSLGFAQGWIEYVDRQEKFRINFPSEPAVEEIMYHSEYGATLPARVYTAEAGESRYALTVVNYATTSWLDMIGATAYAAANIRRRAIEMGAEITYDAYAQIDRIPGIQLQYTEPDGRRVFVAIHDHFPDRRLYIAEASVPRGAPPPALFQAALQILDEEGNRVRYDVDEQGNRVRVREGGGPQPE